MADLKKYTLTLFFSAALDICFYFSCHITKTVLIIKYQQKESIIVKLPGNAYVPALNNLY